MKEGDDPEGAAEATSTHGAATNDNNLQTDASGRQDDDGTTSSTTADTTVLGTVVRLLTWCPPRCRWDPAQPPQFSLFLNVLFGFAGAFTVANLYYNHPILNILARDFGVEYERVAQIPTVMQAGYAAGLLFLCPLGDALPRRPFTLGLVFFTATMWIGLCVTQSLAAFTAISFITAITTVTPQIMLPLVGDLAPPHRRASALSIVVSGFMLGILVARVLSGSVTEHTSWRNVYWLALGLQYLIFVLLWLFMPDYPPTNPSLRSFPAYLRMLGSIASLLATEPVLLQACVLGFFTSAPFTCFWTTLTFLLAGPPYYYTSLVIGLFALIGIAAMCVVPLYARLVIDRLTPLWSVVLGEAAALLGVCLGTYLGPFTVAGPVLEAFLLDMGLQTAQIANRAAIYSIAPKARNRVNTAFMVFTFCGQLTGTAVGSKLYATDAGWVASGSYSVASIGGALLVCLLRGPYEDRWFGWKGGWGLFRVKEDKTTTTTATATTTATEKEEATAAVGVSAADANNNNNTEYTNGVVVDEKSKGGFASLGGQEAAPAGAAPSEGIGKGL